MAKKMERINKLLDIPAELDNNQTKITIVSFEEVLIENYKGILEYEDFFVKLCTNIGNISINGFKLNLIQITTEDIIVKGIINSVDLERNV